MLGNLYVAKGDHVKAQPLFVQAEQELKALRAGGDNSFLLAVNLVQVEGRLGRRDEVETVATFDSATYQKRRLGICARRGGGRPRLHLSG